MLAQELLFFDMDMVVTKEMRGFPKGNTAPELNNCDWTHPVDYTKGTVHVRLEIRSAPKANCLQPSFAIWTKDAEAVSPMGILGRPMVEFTPNPDDIAIGYASFPFSEWIEYGSQKTDWSECRTKMGPVFKSCDGKFISDNNNWGWGGKDPDDWYPMDMRFTCVVVAESATFSGWEKYVD